MHRNYQSNTPVRFYWYTDRVEIQSPGGLYGEVTPETLTTTSSYRNPVIAECMKSLGFVNRFGYGIQRAISLLEQNGNPSPEFKIDDKVFLVTIRKRPE
jgi:ATP-dependent DNA helicase RecG